MVFKPFCFALLGAVSASGAWALQPTVYDTAGFDLVAPGQVQLEGFGRTAETLRTFAGGGVLPLADPRTPFFDTWNIDVSGIAAGTYSFDSMTVNATGNLLFSSVTFNSYDAHGVRDTIVFDLNPAGTQAVGSGTFTVLASCPVASCVWIDVAGSQVAGSPHGYGGTVIATAVPEPASYALMALGLVAVGASRWRARRLEA